MRVPGPLVSNRRRVTRDVTLGGLCMAAGERVSLMWISANRDETVFESPDSVRSDRDQRASLLWGAGVDVCVPGNALTQAACLPRKWLGFASFEARMTLCEDGPR